MNRVVRSSVGFMLCIGCMHMTHSKMVTVQVVTDAQDPESISYTVKTQQMPRIKFQTMQSNGTGLIRYNDESPLKELQVIVQDNRNHRVDQSIFPLRNAGEGAVDDFIFIDRKGTVRYEKGDRLNKILEKNRKTMDKMRQKQRMNRTKRS